MTITKTQIIDKAKYELLNKFPNGLWSHPSNIADPRTHQVMQFLETFLSDTIDKVMEELSIEKKIKTSWDEIGDEYYKDGWNEAVDQLNKLKEQIKNN